MNKRLSNFGRRDQNRRVAGVVLAIMAGLLPAPPAPGAAAYLPTTGPVPLRFESDTAASRPLAWQPLTWQPLHLLLWPEAKSLAAAGSVKTATNSSPVTALRPLAPDDTNDLSLAPTLSEPTNSQTTAVQLVLPVQQYNDRVASPVSPQILSDYFRPVPGAINSEGNAQFEPVQVFFTPPAPKNPTENRATYKIQ